MPFYPLSLPQPPAAIRFPYKTLSVVCSDHMPTLLIFLFLYVVMLGVCVYDVEVRVCRAF